MTTHPLVNVSNVRKSYGKDDRRTEVLRGVTLEIKRGDFIALMGASGSGKTTLLNLIGGLDTCDSGSIEVDGKVLKNLDDKRRSLFRLERIGYVFQFFNLLPNMSVVENVALPLLLLGRGETEAHREANRLGREVGIGDKMHRMVHQLSGGEMQRVGIARALVHRPTIILADEPTGNLDSTTGGVILDLLRQLCHAHQVTMLMATHDHTAARASDHVVLMSDGMLDSTSSSDE